MAKTLTGTTFANTGINTIGVNTFGTGTGTLNTWQTTPTSASFVASNVANAKT